MRNIFILIIATFLAQTTFAQNKVRLGLTVSPTINWLKPDKNLDKGKVRMGAEYGLLLDIALNDDQNYNISTGVILSTAGGNIEGPFGFNARATMQYITLPALLKLKTDKFGDKIAIYGTFGILSSFRVSAKANIETPIINYDKANIVKDAGSADNPTSIESTLFNLSLNGGAGIEYYITDKTSIQGGIFYNHGFVPVIKETTSNAKATLSSLGLRIALIF